MELLTTDGMMGRVVLTAIYGHITMTLILISVCEQRTCLADGSLKERTGSLTKYRPKRIRDVSGSLARGNFSLEQLVVEGPNDVRDLKEPCKWKRQGSSIFETAGRGLYSDAFRN